MPKYIDKDWLLAEANMDGAYGYVSADQIAKAPTDNVVEVVRCKDCKYATGWTTKNGLYGGLTCESLVDMDVDEDFFCAFGEMKENDSVK